MHATNEEKIDITVDDSTNESTEEDLSSPEEVEETLWEISELARRKKRLSPSIMEEIIKTLYPKTINVKGTGILIRENS